MYIYYPFFRSVGFSYSFRKVGEKMIRISFKNLESSELAKEIVTDRIGALIDKFPDLISHKISVRLEMENSPLQSGPDSFSVNLMIEGKKYRRLRIKRSASNLYLAMAHMSDSLLELLNRAGDRDRVKARHHAQTLLQLLKSTHLKPDHSARDASSLNDLASHTPTKHRPT